jgi:hypothetical protein
MTGQGTLLYTIKFMHHEMSLKLCHIHDTDILPWKMDAIHTNFSDNH